MYTDICHTRRRFPPNVIRYANGHYWVRSEALVIVDPGTRDLLCCSPKCEANDRTCVHVNDVAADIARRKEEAHGARGRRDD